MPFRRIAFLIASPLIGAGVLALAALAGAAARAEPVGAIRVLEASAQIEEGALMIAARFETPCQNAEAEWELLGPFGFSARTYAIEASSIEPTICLPALGEHMLEAEVALEPGQIFDDVMIRTSDAMTLIAVEYAQ